MFDEITVYGRPYSFSWGSVSIFSGSFIGPIGPFPFSTADLMAGVRAIQRVDAAEAKRIEEGSGKINRTPMDYNEESRVLDLAGKKLSFDPIADSLPEGFNIGADREG